MSNCLCRKIHLISLTLPSDEFDMHNMDEEKLKLLNKVNQPFFIVSIRQVDLRQKCLVSWLCVVAPKPINLCKERKSLDVLISQHKQPYERTLIDRSIDFFCSFIYQGFDRNVDSVGRSNSLVCVQYLFHPGNEIIA